ncbi:MAG: hypothetical protein LUD39_02525 [Opitutae bacterium]|nr:hypothetical protein [Opitutae bacterium]
MKEPRDWPARWRAAGGQFYGNGLMAALKDDPIWRRISAFGEPTPPFDYGSQMGLSDIDAGEAVELGLISREDAQSAIASFGRAQEQERGTGDGAAGETRPSPLQKLSEKEIEDLIADLSAKPIGDTVAGVKKGAEMSFDEAVKAKPPVNEYDPRDPRTTENCGYCVVANDFRRDGVNVVARQAGSFPESFDSKIFRAALHGHTVPNYSESFTPNAARLLYGITNPEEIFRATREEVLAADFGEKLAPGRYYVSIKAYPSTMHAFTFDKLKNGKLKFFDPQTGAVWADWFPKEYADKLNVSGYRCPVTFFRVDNKKMTKLAEMLVTTP